MLIGTQDDATVPELTSIEEQLAAAWRRHDCEAWGALLADDWSVTHIDRQVITKRDAMEMCRSGPSVSSVVDLLAVRVYGDTAVVTGRTTATVDGDAQQQVILRFTDVFVRGGALASGGVACDAVARSLRWAVRGTTHKVRAADSAATATR